MNNISKVITSADNDEIKYLKKIANKSFFRKKEGYFLVEGKRSISDMDQSLIKKIYITKSFKKANNVSENKNIVVVEDKIFEKISTTINTQGILALAKIKKTNLDIELDNSKFILILDRISDPGNMGTILRTAEACGVDLILAIGCVDIYNPKVVRSTMGSISRQNICEVDKCVLEKVQNKGYKIITSSLNADKYYNDVHYFNKNALVIGSEAFGISEDILNISDLDIKIPMNGGIESLNAAVATGILLYEIRSKIF